MISRRTAFTALLLITTASPALAAATPEGAAKITSALQAYLTAEPGVVTVTPGGETYSLKIDFAPLFAKANQADFSAAMTPLEMTLTEQGNGKWKVDQDQAVEFSFKGGGVADISGKLGSYKGTGIFDEALGYFESTSGTVTGFTYNQVITPPGEGTQTAAYNIESMTYETAMTPAEGDSADGTGHYSMTNISEKVSIPANPTAGMPQMDLDITLASITQDNTIKGIKFKPLSSLVAFFVAHPSKEMIIKDQTALKDLLRDAIPLWTRVEGTASADALKVGSPFGDFGATRLTFAAAMNGIVNDGYFREAFGLEGLTAPAALVPPWAMDLVPTSTAIDFEVSGFDLASPAGMILDNLDLSKDPPLPKDMEQQLLSALLPQGTVKLGLGPSFIINKLSNLGFKGTMTAGPLANPAGEATVTLAGFDALLAAIQAIPAEMGMGQMIPMMMMAKGMSKAGENGALLWEIKSTPEGSVTINGVDPMKM
jgi:hypothetical protein